MMDMMYMMYMMMGKESFGERGIYQDGRIVKFVNVESHGLTGFLPLFSALIPSCLCEAGSLVISAFSQRLKSQETISWSIYGKNSKKSGRDTIDMNYSPSMFPPP